MTVQLSYTVEHRDGKWWIMVEDDQGTTPWTMGWAPTEAKAWATVRLLRLDDDSTDAKYHGQPRKYQGRRF